MIRAPLPSTRIPQGGCTARKSIEEPLAQLDAQRKNLQARLNKQERPRDTRRKVLSGALVLHRIEDGREATADYLRNLIKRELPGFLTREADKEVFADLFADYRLNSSPSEK